MSYDVDDTIAAIGTAAGGAARGMIRLSGPDSVAIIARCCVADDGRILDRLRTATCVAGQLRIDLGEATPTVPCDAFVWPTDRSYTRQPVVELHTLGSPPVLEAALAAVCAAGARLAEPGEFTLRAFLAGRIDLTQAEAVLGVIDARGQDELAASLAQLAGGLGRPLELLRDELLQLLAELEAGLDFVEEDIEFISAAELVERLEWATGRLKDMAEQMASRLTAGQAEQVVLVGRPNVGKSSLFNALVARHGRRIPSGRLAPSAALVSPERGTTRDYLTATIQLEEIRCELVDTAGVDEDWATTIGAAAQALSRERREVAAIRVWCSDAAGDVDLPVDCDVVALTKADVVRRPNESSYGKCNSLPTVVISSRTGAGLTEFCEVLGELLTQDSVPQRGAVVASTAERSRESVRLAEIALGRAIELVRGGSGDELVAAEIRGAIAELGKVVGAVYTDDLLDRIFSGFCIGK
jgi:tRNA modification GTPase